MLPVVYDARLRFPRRQFYCLVQQHLVVDDLFDLDTAVSADNHLRLKQHKTILNSDTEEHERARCYDGTLSGSKIN